MRGSCGRRASADLVVFLTPRAVDRASVASWVDAHNESEFAETARLPLRRRSACRGLCRYARLREWPIRGEVQRHGHQRRAARLPVARPLVTGQEAWSRQARAEAAGRPSAAIADSWSVRSRARRRQLSLLERPFARFHLAGLLVGLGLCLALRPGHGRLGRRLALCAAGVARPAILPAFASACACALRSAFVIDGPSAAPCWGRLARPGRAGRLCWPRRSPPCAVPA